MLNAKLEHKHSNLPVVEAYCGCSAGQAFYNEKGAVVRSFTQAVGHPATRLRIFRDEIARQLIDEAQRLHPDKISFHFGVAIANVDLDNQIVTTSENTDNLVSCACFCMPFYCSITAAFCNLAAPVMPTILMLTRFAVAIILLCILVFLYVLQMVLVSSVHRHRMQLC